MLFFAASPALAVCNPRTEICNPIQANTFSDLVVALARAITAIGIPLVAIFLVWAGFLFVTSRGNEEQLKRAKTTFFWTIIGGAVVIGAWALSIAVVNFARNLGGNGNNTNNPFENSDSSLENNASPPATTPPPLPDLPPPI